MKLSVSEQLHIKITRIIIIIVCTVCIIGFRLAYLQIIQRHNLFSQGERNYQRVKKIRPPRGNILDRNGTLLATNRPVTDIYWHGTGSRIFTPEQNRTISILETILNTENISDENTLRKIRTAERYQREHLIARDLTFEQISRIAEQLADSKNIRLSTQFTRHYPFKTAASHIIGYLGVKDIEQFGKMGLEKIFEEELRGHDGTHMRTINSFGTLLDDIELQKVISGQDVYTTLDIRLQMIAESILTDDYPGTLIMFDPENGDILSLVSSPRFDPEIFLQSIKIEEWRNLQAKYPFINRAFYACYPPGSIFKLITACAALEHNIIQEDTIINCKGFTRFAGRKYGCNRRWGHGELTATQAIAYSCNPLFYEIGKQISIDVLADYAHRFGLGYKTGAAFAERSGIIPSTEWKHATHKERWWPGETLSATIGQSYLLVTPIQIARMLGSIFTKELAKPRIILHEPIEKYPLDIKPETLAFIQNAMYEAVQKGTSRRLARLKDMTIHAKTSTAQVSALQKRLLDTKYLEHGWCILHAQYKQEKPFVLVVLVENAGNSSVPTLLAKTFLEQYMKIIEMPAIAISNANIA